MKRFYLSGQNTFANRGCEAIVRSTVQLLKEQFGQIEVLTPSVDVRRDSAQWPDHASHGVRFVRAYKPSFGRYWVNLQRLPLPALKRAAWPFPMPSWLKQQLASVDAVLAIGGDNYSLDYRIPSPVMGLDAFAMQLKKPVFLWGSSVGPFDREPHLIRPMIKHLSLMQFVAVRESVSHDYLTRRLGLRNVIKMADPAFTLQPETVDLVPFWPDMAGEGVLGVNISHLIERYKQDGQDIRSEVAAFVRHVVKNMGMGVLLIPHVHPLTGNHESGDASYMAGLQGRLSDLGASVAMMPHRFNAAQIKHVISHLRFFIGARTHATIAALSSGVPTISIAYSIKARGINKDLFGHEDAVLQTPEVSADSLAKALEWLFEKEDVLRERLDAGVPKLREEARAAAARIRNVLSN